MSRSKLKKYHDAKQSPFIIQEGKSLWNTLQGNWRKDFFHNNNPIVLELACGRGEYSVGLSQVYLDKNFIGVDIKAERMMQGVKLWKEATGKKYPDTNIAFLRTIIQHIDQFFAPNEVDEIRIVHPDPRPKSRDEKRRLTSDRFLTQYQTILKSGGLLRLTTDDPNLYQYSRRKFEEHNFQLIHETDNLDTSLLKNDHHNIVTHYGLVFKEQGRTIHYGVWKNTK